MKLDLVLDEGPLPWHPTDDWTKRAREMLAGAAPGESAVQFVLTDDATLQEHNREYRDLDRPTDVLSFSYLGTHEAHAAELLSGSRDVFDFLDDPVTEDEDPLVGQILVSLETLQRRGTVHAADLDGEVAFMLAHGCLHVLGFDHHDEASARAMQAAEVELMRRGGFALAPSDESGERR